MIYNSVRLFKSFLLYIAPSCANLSANTIQRVLLTFFNLSPFLTAIPLELSTAFLLLFFIGPLIWFSDLYILPLSRFKNTKSLFVYMDTYNDTMLVVFRNPVACHKICSEKVSTHLCTYLLLPFLTKTCELWIINATLQLTRIIQLKLFQRYVYISQLCR